MVACDELEHWDEGGPVGRQRQWFSVDVAKKLLSIYKPVSSKIDDDFIFIRHL